MSTATGPRSLKERQREERERLILEAGEELILEKGYHETSMDDIAARVGVSKGTVYLHFPGKEDLILALLERDMRDFAGILDAILASDDSPGAKLHRLIELVYGEMSGRHVRLVDTVFQSPELRSRFFEKKDSLRDHWETFARRLGEVIEAGQAAGELDAAFPAPVLVGLFSSLLNPRTFTFAQMAARERISRDELAGYASRLFFHGAAARAAGRG